MESNWRHWHATEGMSNGIGTLAAWILEEGYEGWLLLNSPTGSGSARMFRVTGTALEGGYIPQIDPAANFPYGIAVAPDG